MLFLRINNWPQSVHSTDNQSDIKDLFISTSISPNFTFFVAENITVYTPSQGTKLGKVL